MFEAIAVGLTLGFAGSPHCVAMCGGIVAALSLSPATTRRWLAPALYSLGRLAAYAILGVAFSTVGGLAADAFAMQGVLRALAAAFLIILGSRLVMSERPFHSLEAFGYPVWRRVQPLAARMTMLQNPVARFICGMLWGFLPCGMVYGALALALATRDPVRAGLLMLSFGLATVPAIVGAGWLGNRLVTTVRRRRVQIVGGLLLVGYGLWGFHQFFAGPVGWENHADRRERPVDRSFEPR